MLNFTGKRVYLACGKTDMRMQINGLAELVTSSFRLDPFDEAIFVFCNRNRDRLKILKWDGDGLRRNCVELHMNYRSCSFTSGCTSSGWRRGDSGGRRRVKPRL